MGIAMSFLAPSFSVGLPWPQNRVQRWRGWRGKILPARSLLKRITTPKLSNNL